MPVASSAVDMYSIVTAAMANFEDSGMHGATSVKLREQFATAKVYGRHHWATKLTGVGAEITTPTCIPPGVTRTVFLQAGFAQLEGSNFICAH